tara:strand:- start:2031 stop:3065 length:1035 start_codon:yes stop_codon:yes gene_type:complete
MAAREKSKQRTAGLFVLIGLLLLGVLIVEFGRFGDRFKGHYPLFIEFPQTAGIIKNSEVRLRGAKIGRVATHPELVLTGSTSSVVKMEIRIKDDVRIPLDSTFKIGSIGLLGDKFIAIIPPDNESEEYYQSGDTIIGIGAGGIDAIKSNAADIARDASQLIKDAKVTFSKIDKALNSMEKIGASIDVAMNKVNNEVLAKDNIDNFTKAIANFEESSRDFKSMSHDLKPAVIEARKTMTTLKDAAENASHLITEARDEINSIKPALAEIPAAVKNISNAASRAEDTMAAMQNKNGLIGTLAYDQETGNNAKEFIRNLKRYGVLRYRDKSTNDERDPRNKFRGSRR